jgi:hypothetical protein
MEKRKLTSVGNLALSTPQPKRRGKTEPKSVVRLKRTDGEQSDFKSLNEVTSMRHCLNCLSKDNVPASGPLLIIIFVPKF